MWQTLLIRGIKFLGKEAGKEIAITVITAAGSAVAGSILHQSDDEKDPTLERPFASRNEAKSLLREIKGEYPELTETTWTADDVRNLSSDEFEG